MLEEKGSGSPPDQTQGAVCGACPRQREREREREIDRKKEIEREGCSIISSRK